MTPRSSPPALVSGAPIFRSLVRDRSLDGLLSTGPALDAIEVARVGIELTQAPGGLSACAPAADDEPQRRLGDSDNQPGDVYRIGVVLYRLLTNGADGIDAVDPAPHAETWRLKHDLRNRRSGVPLVLAQVVERAVDPRADARYATVAALATDLEAAERELRDLRAANAPLRRRLRYGAALAAMLALVALGLVVALAPPERGAVTVRFEHAGASGDASAIADGLTIELTRLLARVKHLEVRAALPPSADLYKPLDVAAFGGQRRATLVVSGTLHGEAGAWRRIDASLVNVREGRTMWSESLPVEDNDVWLVLERIRAAVVEALQLTFDTTRPRYSTTPDRQERFLRGRALQARRSDAVRMAAADLFQQIAIEEPGFVPASAALAATLGGIALGTPDVPALDERMAPAARRAYESDPGLAEANAAMGLVSARRCDWAQAQSFFIDAIRLDPTATSVSVDYAFSTLLPLGRHRQAVGVLRAALESDPRSLDLRNALAHILVENRDYDEAIELSHEVVADAPGLQAARQTLNRALFLAGRMARPIEAVSPDAQWGYHGYILAAQGRRDDARRLADAHPREPARQMLIYAALNDRERAFDALQRTARLNPWRALTWMGRVEIEPVFRNDPRAAALREQLTGPSAPARCVDSSPAQGPLRVSNGAPDGR